MRDFLPEGRGLDDNLYSPGQRTVSGESIIDVDGNIVLRLAGVWGDIDLVFLCCPRWGTSGPKNASGCGVSFSSDTEGCRWVVIIPGIPSNEYVRRVGSHGRRAASVPSP